MRPPLDRSARSRRIGIVYHSAAGGTRLVAELVGDLLSAHHEVRVAGVHQPQAAVAALDSDFTVLCYPTYFLKPSPSMREFVQGLEPQSRPRSAYLVTTYELYPENSLRHCALWLRDKGVTVTGTACVRAPGSDLTCVLPDWLCPWLYRFGRGLAGRLRCIASQIDALSGGGAPARVPRPRWYTAVAQALQRGLLDGFFEWRKRIRILPERCTACGLCVSGCYRGAWVRVGGKLRHDPERCELCTRCIHRCPQNAIVLHRAFRDNKRLDARHYAGLKAAARQALFPAGGGRAT